MKDDWMVTFTIPLGHGLNSPDTLDAYELRNAIEADMQAAGMVVCGAGVGFGGMDLSIDANMGEKESIAAEGEAIIQRYGLECEVTIDNFPSGA